ncbi:hypothetical protein [Corallococcus exiguus]|uniref:hypothetical protein n=1 Tax=Corallococcus exiguus TaxID=83462 RepID=UPI001470905B|nr:hypothetical protein [Corallococcus exiguus]NNB89468.1 hypothetical protein [Corallococcus exiguus]
MGVLYRDDAGGAWLLHQAWNRDSRNETFDAFRAGTRGAPLFLVPPGLDVDEQSAVRASAVLAAKLLPEGGLPYAFGSATLDREKGFLLGESCGLSCATLVNVVFQTARVALVDESTWASQRTSKREAEDREAKTRVAAWLNAGDREQALRIGSEPELGRPRLRAEEVAAASSQTTRPLDLCTAEPLGQQVLAEMDSLIAEVSTPALPVEQPLTKDVTVNAGLRTE